MEHVLNVNIKGRRATEGDLRFVVHVEFGEEPDSQPETSGSLRPLSEKNLRGKNGLPIE